MIIMKANLFHGNFKVVIMIANLFHGNFKVVVMNVNLKGGIGFMGILQWSL